MTVFVNPFAGSGSAIQRWERVSHRLSGSLERLSVHMLNGRATTEQKILEALRDGETNFIAAGGDGTVNILLNMLLELATPEQLRHLRIGAIGLGSSNDFHKPFNTDALVEGISCKIGFETAQPRDVGVVKYENSGYTRSRFFLINASAGATAAANNFFNNPDRILRSLKRLNTQSAIMYSAIKTILSYRNFPATITSPPSGSFMANISNLGVIKNPNFSGKLSYSGSCSYNNGKFGIYLCHDMTPLNLIKLLAELGKGKFSETPKTVSWSAPSVTVAAEQAIAVELDGEIILTKKAEFAVLPHYLMVCP